MAANPEPPADWREANRATWDARVKVHLGAPEYDLAPLREGRARLHPIEEREIGDITGLRIAHLQCHFGRDSLTLAQKGAGLVAGLDFSPAAISAARALADELGLSARARFVEADLYDAPEALADLAPFDMVYVTWGTLGWLPDVAGWARVVAGILRPGGRLYFADGHPGALVFETADTGKGGARYYAPYFARGAERDDDPTDYTGDFPKLGAGHDYWFNHTLGDIVNAVLGAGLKLEFLNEHDELPWPMFACLEPAPGGMFRWPEKPWLPLAFSLGASKAA